MQVKHLVAALVIAFPLAASAQSSVTIYGIADASIGREDTGAPSGSKTVVVSGNQSTSRIGFRGVEDIGSGLKAIFNIEAGVAIDSGAADTAGLFQRRAVVGLQGNFGTVTVGREYTPLNTIAANSDPLAQTFYGSSLGAFGGGRMTRRISNSVNYVTPATLGGFRVLAGYGLGETTTGPSKDLMGIAVDYTNGPVYVGGGYQVFENIAGGDDKEAMVGAGFKISQAFDIKGYYVKTNPQGPNNEYEMASLGGTFTTGASKFFANYSQQKAQNGGKGNAVTVGYTYNLSKRTNLYGTYAELRNNNRGTFGLTSAGSSVVPLAANAGSDPSAFAIGVRHSF